MIREWHSQKESFEVIDLRKIKNCFLLIILDEVAEIIKDNFLPMILEEAGGMDVGSGICVVQSFEPITLYSALSDLGFQHLTEKVSADEYRVYFYRSELREPSTPTGMS